MAINVNAVVDPPTKAQVGLGNVDNTSDANKPVSTAQQAAIDTKVSKADHFIRYHIQWSVWSPTNNTTAYFSTFITAPPMGANARKTYFRKAGTIKEVDLTVFVTGSTPSAESWSLYLRVNNATDYLVATVANTATEKVFLNSAMNVGAGIPINAGDYFEMKIVNPTWATPPVNTIASGGVHLYLT